MLQEQRPEEKCVLKPKRVCRGEGCRYGLQLIMSLLLATETIMVIIFDQEANYQKPRCAEHDLPDMLNRVSYIHLMGVW